MEITNLLHFLCALGLASSDTGVSLSLKDKTVPNHGLVYVDDIGETDYDSLKCTTDLEDCCDNEDLGSWSYPNYGLVKSEDESDDDVFYSSRGKKVVRLHRTNMPTKMVGIMRCEVPDAKTYPQESTLHVGIYNYNEGLPEIYNIHVDRVLKAINCFSRGGPVTEFSWVKDGVAIPLQSGSAYSQSRVIIDFGTSNYLISLRATKESDLVGSFKCVVNNSAGSHERTIVISSDFSVKSLRGCGALASVENGRWELSDGFNIGSKVTFFCREFYRLYNLRDVTCLDGGTVGQWTDGNHPVCEKELDCKEGFDTTSGLLVKYSNKFIEFSVASFSCAHTHRMIGTGNPATCRNEKWDGRPPACELIRCPFLDDINNGDITVTNNRTVGSKATYKCNKPYIPSSEIPVRECHTSGVWTGEDIQCIVPRKIKSDRICALLYIADKVKVIYTHRQVFFECPKGYILTGSRSATCSHKTRLWVGNKPPKCKKAAGIMLSYDGVSLLAAVLWILTTIH